MNISRSMGLSNELLKEGMFLDRQFGALLSYTLYVMEDISFPHAAGRGRESGERRQKINKFWCHVYCIFNYYYIVLAKKKLLLYS